METIHPFTVSRNIIFKTLILNPSTGWLLWIVFLIGLALIGLGSVVDLRYLVIGLIIWVGIIPTMAFFQFINYMFASEMVANLLHHTVECRPNGYLIRIYRPADPNDSNEKDETWIESGRLTIFDSSVVKRKLTNEYEVVFLKDAPLSMLYVPRRI